MNKILYVYFTSVLLICSIGKLMAQQSENIERISFLIQDIANQKPLAFATCRVFTAEGKPYTYAISDNSGKLTVSVNKNDLLAQL